MSAWTPVIMAHTQAKWVWDSQRRLASLRVLGSACLCRWVVGAHGPVVPVPACTCEAVFARFERALEMWVNTTGHDPGTIMSTWVFMLAGKMTIPLSADDQALIAGVLTFLTRHPA